MKVILFIKEKIAKMVKKENKSCHSLNNILVFFSNMNMCEYIPDFCRNALFVYKDHSYYTNLLAYFYNLT